MSVGVENKITSNYIETTAPCTHYAYTMLSVCHLFNVSHAVPTLMLQYHRTSFDGGREELCYVNNQELKTVLFRLSYPVDR